MAAKRDVVKRQAGLKPGTWSFVWVGNLNATITEAMLRSAFRACGTIARVQLRGMNEHHYASIEFLEQSSPKRAVDTLHGKMLGSVKMVVCYSVADLPETQESIRRHLLKGKGGKVSRISTYLKAIKGLTVERTLVASELLGDGNDESARQVQAGPSGQALTRTSGIPPPNSKHLLMGISFPKTLM